MYDYGLIALVSFISSFVLVVLAIYLFPKIGLKDRPHLYGLKRKPIPYYGGVVIFLAFLIVTLWFVELSTEVVGLLIAGGIIALIGFLDDLFKLSPVLRLFVQICAAALLVLFGVGILSISNPLGGAIVLDAWNLEFSIFDMRFFVPIFGAIFTIIWMVLITNTMNFLDGIGGLTSGVTFIAGLTIFFLSTRAGLHADLVSQETVAVLALILAFVSFAFLMFDFPKSKILMGDTGSTFLGFMLAALAIFSGGKVATAFLVLGVPILDVGWVVLRRLFEGKKPWQGDLTHLHHRLLELGFKEASVLAILYCLSLVFGVLAIVCTSTQQKFFVIIGLGVLMVLLVASISMVGSKGSSGFRKG
ncbi:undecaprenyl/decaprenyl-phosphate alpha-N-acetylglucosaminyl 1-phosphate transferase [Candidatus Peregrinibacteria bacterium]|jgi:UDP-GlcNAc:undecaprenyl-phosphate/decaprenyl-phosphate GlcNAc-1-phosphate transferase|nr:undecaprenyl/decaprenyl-phosphate alpha-N-acetylglucosaminyl 1-phosphate transferase [Candidatus Peregrinibacteria bacterium]